MLPDQSAIGRTGAAGDGLFQWRLLHGADDLFSGRLRLVWADADEHTHQDADADEYAHQDAYTDEHAHQDADADKHADANTEQHGDGHSDTIANADSVTDACMPA